MFHQPEVQNLMMSINGMELENEKLRLDYLDLNKSMALLRKKINTMEQHNLHNYVEIIGIPVNMDVNCVNVVEEIGAVLEVVLTVVKAERLPYDKLTKTNRIVAELLTYEQKLNLIRKSKQNQLSINCIEKNVIDSYIYIHDHLTEYNRILYFHTKMFAKEKGFKHVWYADCQIFMKKYDHSQIFLIEKKTDLYNIK